MIQWIKNEWERVGVQFCVDLECPKTEKEIFYRLRWNQHQVYHNKNYHDCSMNSLEI